MDIKPIKTEADCDAALAEIAQLMDAEPDTPEYDRHPWRSDGRGRAKHDCRARIAPAILLHSRHPWRSDA